MKRGDEVWIKAVVLKVSETAGVRLAVGEYGCQVWIAKSKCKLVEPEAVVKQSLTSQSNYSEIPNSSSDPVNPSHYKQGPAETIDIIEAAIAKAPNNKAAGLHWQVLKYALRCWFKGGIEDLKKARWYLDRLIQEEEVK
jgi:hypothetical protein